jgi:glycine/D-amino acid oxidase-like deaminating enzyme
MSVSYWQDTVGLTLDLDADVTIIGGGLAGLSTAYWLSKKDPNLSIIVVEKGQLGHGASGRNAGFITCGSTEHFSRMTAAYGEGKAEEIWKFTEYNHNLMREEFGVEKLEELCEYRNLGSWTLAATEHEIEVTKATVAALQEKGVNVEWKDEAYPGTEGFHGGAFYADDGEIHPAKYLWHLGLRTGDAVSIMENAEVFGIDEEEGSLVVRTNKKRIKTEAIVVCTNAWSGQLFPWFQDKIAPTRGQIIVTEPVDHFLQPSYCSFVLDYFRQLVDGRVLIGGFRNADVEREVGFSDEVNPIIHEKLEGFLNDHFPALRGKRIDYRWSGVMGFAADGYPLVGSLPEDPRIFYNVGFTAHGLGFTFATGELTADLILAGQDPGIFSGRRFQ